MTLQLGLLIAAVALSTIILILMMVSSGTHFHDSDLKYKAADEKLVAIDAKLTEFNSKLDAMVNKIVSHDQPLANIDVKVESVIDHATATESLTRLLLEAITQTADRNAAQTKTLEVAAMLLQKLYDVAKDKPQPTLPPLIPPLIGNKDDDIVILTPTDAQKLKDLETLPFDVGTLKPNKPKIEL